MGRVFAFDHLADKQAGQISLETLSLYKQLLEKQCSLSNFSKTELLSKTIANPSI